MKLLRQTGRLAVSVIQSSAQWWLPPPRLSWRPSGSPFAGGPGAARWAGPPGGRGRWAGPRRWRVAGRLGGAHSGLGSSRAAKAAQTPRCGKPGRCVARRLRGEAAAGRGAAGTEVGARTRGGRPALRLRPRPAAGWRGRGAARGGRGGRGRGRGLAWPQGPRAVRGLRVERRLAGGLPGPEAEESAGPSVPPSRPGDRVTGASHLAGRPARELVNRKAWQGSKCQGSGRTESHVVRRAGFIFLPRPLPDLGQTWPKKDVSPIRDCGRDLSHSGNRGT
ncbi:hypothetical protein ACRRTK_003199 [Alexandromys fortis]